MICIHCHYEFYVSQETLGSTIRCPNCTSSIIINQKNLVLPCTECNGPISVEIWMVGAQTTCPHCNKNIMLTLGDESSTYLDRDDPTQSAKLSMANFQAGDTVGKYTISRCLGIGGMGEVYLANHTLLGTKCAIKVLKQEIARQDPETRERLLREARLASCISHPNLIAVLDAEVDEQQDYSYIVMEYVDGVSLEKLLINGAMLEERVLEIIYKVSEALKVASAHRIIHRDIKPANIMLSSRGEVKLADLGIAKIENDTHGMTLTLDNAVLGTPNYASPEQLRSSHKVDVRADIYSLGATMYHMLSGTRPFEADSVFGVMANVLEKTPESLSKLNPGLSSGTVSLVEKMMDKNPDKRPQNIDELLDSLLSVMNRRTSFRNKFKRAISKFKPKKKLAVNCKKAEKRNFYPVAIAGILCALLGILVLLNPWKTFNYYYENTKKNIENKLSAPKVNTQTVKKIFHRGPQVARTAVSRTDERADSERTAIAPLKASKYSFPQKNATAPAGNKPAAKPEQVITQRSIEERMIDVNSIQDSLEAELSKLVAKNSMAYQDVQKVAEIRKKIDFRKEQLRFLNSQVLKRTQVKANEQKIYDTEATSALTQRIKNIADGPGGNAASYQEIKQMAAQLRANRDIDPNAVLKCIASQKRNRFLFVEMISALCDMDADFNQVDAFQVCSYSRPAWAKVLASGIDHIDKNINPHFGTYLNFILSRIPDKNCVELLIKSNCRLDIYNNLGQQPLHIALKSPWAYSTETLEMLLLAGAPLNSPQNAETDLLTWAISQNVSPAKVQLLIRAGVPVPPLLASSAPVRYKKILTEPAPQAAGTEKQPLQNAPAQQETGKYFLVVAEKEENNKVVKNTIERRLQKADNMLKRIAERIKELELNKNLTPEESQKRLYWLKRQQTFFTEQRNLLYSQRRVKIDIMSIGSRIFNLSDTREFVRYINDYAKRARFGYLPRERERMRKYLKNFSQHMINPNIKIQDHDGKEIPFLQMLVSNRVPESKAFIEEFIRLKADFNAIDLKRSWSTYRTVPVSVLDCGLDDIDTLLPLELSFYQHLRSEEAIKKLIKLGADVYCPLFNNTALHLAASNCNTQIITDLLLAGSDPGNTNGWGETALYVAVKNGNSGAEKLLRSLGVVPDHTNHKDGNIEDARKHGKFVQAITINSFWSERERTIRRFVTEGGNIDSLLPNQETPLVFACRTKNRRLCELLVSLGADPNKSCNPKIALLRTRPLAPLIAAFDNNDLKTFTWLLETGANVNHTNYYSMFSRMRMRLDFLNALADSETEVHQNLVLNIFWAYRYLSRRHNIDRPLIKLIKKTSFLKQRQVIIFRQCMSQQIPDHVLKVLIDKMDINLTDSHNGDTMLHVAAQYNRPELITYLAGKGANINKQNNSAQTPLHTAARHKARKAYSELIKCGAKRNIRDNQGKTASDYR